MINMSAIREAVIDYLMVGDLGDYPDGAIVFGYLYKQYI